MTDVKRLLEEATPLPWSHRPNHKPYHVVAFGKNGWRDGYTTADIERGDAALIVHAVNRLPDYEAAVDALEALLNTQYSLQISGHDVECNLVQTSGLPCSCGKDDALRNADAALRRLRGAA